MASPTSGSPKLGGESSGRQDMEIQVMEQSVCKNGGLQRQLKSRHLQMIAIGMYVHKTTLSHHPNPRHISVMSFMMQDKLSLGTKGFVIFDLMQLDAGV